MIQPLSLWTNHMCLMGCTPTPALHAACSTQAGPSAACIKVGWLRVCAAWPVRASQALHAGSVAGLDWTMPNKRARPIKCGAAHTRCCGLVLCAMRGWTSLCTECSVDWHWGLLCTWCMGWIWHYTQLRGSVWVTGCMLHPAIPTPHTGSSAHGLPGA